MAESSGLTRRRGAAAASGSAENDDGSRVASPAPRRNDDRTPETSYENSANGHKIAFDPRDISESAERSKQPKLTLMEEVLLLGLKDKQVRQGRSTLHMPSRLKMNLRAICHSGTIISPTHSEDVLLSSWRSVAE